MCCVGGWAKPFYIAAGVRLVGGITIFSIFAVMDFWAVIGVISSVLGIFSFLKNEVFSSVSLLKKIC